jgi:hypothetical protein
MPDMHAAPKPDVLGISLGFAAEGKQVKALLDIIHARRQGRSGRIAMIYPMPITVSKSEFNLGEYDLIYWCRRPSTVVNLHSVTTCDVQGPIYKLSYDAKTI